MDLIFAALLAGLVGLLLPELRTLRWRGRFPWLVAARPVSGFSVLPCLVVLVPVFGLAWAFGLAWLWLEAGAGLVAAAWLAFTAPE